MASNTGPTEGIWFVKPIKPPGPLSRLPKQRRTPYTLPLEPTTHAANSVQTNCGLRMSKGGQSKRPTGASLGRKLNNSPRFFQRIHHYFDEIGASTWMRQEFAEYRSKKSSHISGQGNIQITRITGRDSSGCNELGTQAGAKAGINQPVVHSLDGTRRRDPAWLEVPLPSGPLIVQYSAVKKNKKLRPPGPLNRLVHTTLSIIPALGAFIGPKQIMPRQFWRWLWQQAPATGLVQPRTA